MTANPGRDRSTGETLPSGAVRVTTVSGTDRLEIRGARTHNLRAVDVAIPHGKMTVITGPSGCGKSSLAIDTIFAEGQRQYIETLSVHARQFVHQLPRADVDSIEGLEPTLRVDQHQAASGRRSTVGTVTGIQDCLRLLFARLGTQTCHRCRQPVRPLSPEKICQWVAQLPEGTRVMLLAPLVRARSGDPAEAIEKIRRERLVRCRIDGKVCDIDSVPELDARQPHTVEAVADRIVVRPGSASRLAESLGIALALSGGSVQVAWQHPDDGDLWQEQLFTTRQACPHCEISYPPVEPNSFSFNSPQGACPHCQGLGGLEQFAPALVFADRTLPLPDWVRRNLGFWPGKQQSRWLESLAPLLAFSGLDTTLPVQSWTDSQFAGFWNGDGRGTDGFSRTLEKMYFTATRAELLNLLGAMRTESECPACRGGRLRPESLAILLRDENAAQVAAKSVSQLASWLEQEQNWFGSREISEPIVLQLRSRLKYLLEVGLDYLTVDRAAHSLSGGEYQRVRLAAAIGNDLTSCCFVLDEPSIGLHPRDSHRLTGTLQRLCAAGNTVIVVEHDEAVMRAADLLVDMGPGAGKNGGRVVACGTAEEIAALPDSPTGRYLAQQTGSAEAPVGRPTPDSGRDWITLSGATGHNLKGITVRFPVARLTAVTGVSGSGKSTLVNETLVPAFSRRIGRTAADPAPHLGLEGGSSIQRVIPVDQRPLGRSPRGCPATYAGIMDSLRRLFASTRDAKRLGFGPERFSFNSAGGWCPDCRGLGQRRIRMKFLPDLFVVCESCQGTRYHPQILRCRFRGASISDFLNMDISVAAAELSGIAGIHGVLATLDEVGLGYLQLGQSTATLSGGECQRLKLASELVDNLAPPTLFVLDEPTTGLHFGDVERLVAILQKLVGQGHTVIVIEHHPGLIRASDWVIDLGPEGGDGGGTLMVAGIPADVARDPHSHTAAWLREYPGIARAGSSN